jgi:hypothetical protein
MTIKITVVQVQSKKKKKNKILILKLHFFFFKQKKKKKKKNQILHWLVRHTGASVLTSTKFWVLHDHNHFKLFV